MVHYQNNMYQNKVNDDEWGQFDDLEEYDIYEIQRMSVNINVNKKRNIQNAEKEQVNDTIINIKNSFNSFCEIHHINIEFNSLVACCRFWVLFSVISGTAILSSWITKEELCKKDNK